MKGKKKTKQSNVVNVDKELKFHLVFALILILGFFIGVQYYKTQHCRIEIIKKNYDYCVQGCMMSADFKFIINNTEQQEEVLNFIDGKLVTIGDKKIKCFKQCEKLLHKDYGG
jgi:hypothetical protein